MKYRVVFKLDVDAPSPAAAAMIATGLIDETEVTASVRDRATGRITRVVLEKPECTPGITTRSGSPQAHS